MVQGNSVSLSHLQRIQKRGVGGQSKEVRSDGNDTRFELTDGVKIIKSQLTRVNVYVYKLLNFTVNCLHINPN